MMDCENIKVGFSDANLEKAKFSLLTKCQLNYEK
jgi:hypothetical protein